MIHSDLIRSVPNELQPALMAINATVKAAKQSFVAAVDSGQITHRQFDDVCLILDMRVSLNIHAGDSTTLELTSEK